MSSSVIQEMLNEIEELLASAGDLVPEVELPVEKLLNEIAEHCQSTQRQSTQLG